jgi:hypothetical protein
VQLRFRLCCGLLTEDKRHCNINPLATKIQAGRLELKNSKGLLTGRWTWADSITKALGVEKQAASTCR